jgi:hypothetical protein
MNYVEYKYGEHGYKMDFVVDTCRLCKEDCYNICNNCGLGTKMLLTKHKYIDVKCPNKHLYHSECINSWARHDSYCPICEEELIDVVDKCECYPHCINTKCECGKLSEHDKLSEHNKYVPVEISGNIIMLQQLTQDEWTNLDWGFSLGNESDGETSN